MPIIIACAAASLLGLLSWYIEDKLIVVCYLITLGTCALWWTYRDSRRLNRPIGTFVPVIILLIQPVGMLIWFAKSRRWKGLVAFLAYLGVFACVSASEFVGFVIGGIMNGHSLADSARYYAGA